MDDFFRVRILGCGSASGVPRIGGVDEAGNWGACNPLNQKNYRRRCSILVTRVGAAGETRVLVDTPPELREQLISAKVANLDGVLVTHDHADQTHGIEDLRYVSANMKQRVNIWSDAATLSSIIQRFSYCFGNPTSAARPIVEARELIEPFDHFAINGAGGKIPILPFSLGHGQIRSLGFRIGPIAYSPDANILDEKAFEALEGVKCWIVDGVSYKPNRNHAHIARTLEWIARVKPSRAIVTNMDIDVDYETLSSELPHHVEPAFDGMELNFPLQSD